MSKKMLINATHPEENRVAIVEDGILTELDIEIAGKEQTKGNIYKAAVVRVEPGLQAAFIDYGAERFGFLQMGEIHPSYFRNENGTENKRPRINDVLRRGQELLVQVVKEERGTKGAALTTFLSLPGRYMVLMPESDSKGISRKIEDDSQRKKLKEAMASLDLPSNMGYIVRTAGIGQKKEELKRDFDYLVRVYETIQEQARKSKAPALIYKESNLAIRSLRDYFSSDMDEVLVDDPKVADEARDFFQQVMPEYARLVKLHQERRPIFSRYQIEEQIETITKNKVQLPSGGSIVIDVTEALVAVDVNSGKMAGEQGVESTAYKTNLEAATEVGRQLRLRDLGGLIVIDFIDMRERKHVREVEKNLKDALKNDKARVTVGRISQFGLLEMSRQRIKAALAEGSFLPCPHCGGSGKIKSAEAQAVAFLRKVQSSIAKGQIGRVEGEVPLDVATYLLNVKREELLDMERRHQLVLVIKGRPDLLAGQTNLSVFKREKEEVTAELERTPYPAPSLIPASTSPAFVPMIVELPEEEAVLPSESPGDEGAKKKRKRRRKRKKTEEGGIPETEIPAGEGASAGTAVEEEGEEEAGDLEEEPQTAAEAGPGEERRRKRRRRRRKKGPAAEAEAAAAEDREALAATPSESVAEESHPPLVETFPPSPEGAGATAEESATPKRKPARPRRRPGERKSAQEEGPRPEAMEAPPSPQEPPPSPEGAGAPAPAPGEAPAPEKKRRPSRRKASASAAEPSPPAPAPKEGAPPEAPKRRPARRRKEAEPKAEPTEAPAPAAEDEGAKPKRRSSRRKAEETPSEE